MSSRDIDFLVVGDVHVGHDADAEADLFARLCDHINTADRRPEFVIFLGDLTNFGTPAQYTRLKELLADCPVPVHLVRGNHDKGGYATMLADAPVVSPPQAEPEERVGQVLRWNSFYWEENPHNATSPVYPNAAHYGFYDDAQVPLCATWDAYRADQAFDVAGRRFVIMDAARWIFSAEQMQWLADQLAAGHPTVLVMHHHLLPVRYVFDAATVWNAPDVLRLVREHPNVLAVLHGHVHFNRQWTYGGRPVVTTSLREWRHVRICANDAVEVGPALTDEPPVEEYRPWNLVTTGFQGTMFRVRDTRLWRFKRATVDAGQAWGGPSDTDQGLEWTTFVDVPNGRSACRFRVCVAACGSWRVQVTDPDGRQLASRSGTGTCERQDIDLDVTLPCAGDYRLSFTQPDASDGDWVRCAHFALVDLGDGRPAPPLWCWGQEAGTA